ncbi:MAG: PQQ-dependent sugar dehydrogenase, partial [Chthoniobacterales bacterium]
MKFATILLLLPMTVFAAADVVTSSAHRFRMETVADGLEHPWAVAKLPDGDFLVTERAGRVLRIGKDGAKTPVAGVPEVVVKGQGGL